MLTGAARRGEAETRQWTYVRKDRSRLAVQLTVTAVLDEGGQPKGFIGIAVDMSERRRAEAALRTAEQRFRRAFDDAPMGMAIVAATPAVLGQLMDVNKAMCDLTGDDRDSLLTMKLGSLTGPAGIGADVETISQMLSGEVDRSVIETQYVTAAGDTIEVSVGLSLIRDGDGSALHVIALIDDVSSRKRYESHLRHMADHDPLTALPNRVRMEQALDAQVARVRRYAPVGALLIIDVDHFKQINDRLGHGAGDRILVGIARILQTRVRDTDVLARLSGDEFAVLITEGGEAEAQTLASDLSDLVRRRAVVLEGGTPGAPPDRGRPEGRPLPTAPAARHGPSYRRHRQIRGAVADDRRGWIDDPPGAFLYVAERFDQITAIDRWVIEHAVALLADIPHGRSLEINLSGRSLGDPSLAAHIGTVITTCGADPGRLIFEITETAAIENIHRAQEFVNELTALGCRFALDDFGASFGSFYYIKHLSSDYIKIDGEFVRDCIANRDDQIVIQALVQLARGLGKETIAEFVENADVLTLIRALGVDHAQGYAIARPQPLARLLEQQT